MRNTGMNACMCAANSHHDHLPGGLTASGPGSGLVARQLSLKKRRKSAEKWLSTSRIFSTFSLQERKLRMGGDAR